MLVLDEVEVENAKCLCSSRRNRSSKRAIRVPQRVAEWKNAKSFLIAMMIATSIFIFSIDVRILFWNMYQCSHSCTIRQNAGFFLKTISLPARNESRPDIPINHTKYDANLGQIFLRSCCSIDLHANADDRVCGIPDTAGTLVFLWREKRSRQERSTQQNSEYRCRSPCFEWSFEIWTFVA